MEQISKRLEFYLKMIKECREAVKHAKAEYEKAKTGTDRLWEKAAKGCLASERMQLKTAYRWAKEIKAEEKEQKERNNALTSKQKNN